MLLTFIFLLLAITTQAGRHKKTHKKRHFISTESAENTLRKRRKKSIMNAAQVLAGDEHDASIHNCIWHSEDLCADIKQQGDALVAQFDHITYDNVWLEDSVLDIELNYCETCNSVHNNDECICEFIHGESMQSLSGSCAFPKMQIGNVCYNLFDDSWNDNHMCGWQEWYPFSHHRQIINGTLHHLPLRPCNFECVSNCAISHMGSLGITCATVVNDLLTCGTCTSQQNALWLGFTHCSCDHHDQQTPCESDYACQWNATGQVCELNIDRDSSITGNIENETYINTQCIDDETALVTHYGQPGMTCQNAYEVNICRRIGNVCAVTCGQCGCTDSAADNYQPDALVDDGTCNHDNNDGSDEGDLDNHEPNNLCVDNDILVAQFAGSMGITSCSAASEYCNHPDFPNIMVACCATCTTPDGDSGHHSGSGSGMDSWEEYGEGSEEHDHEEGSVTMDSNYGGMGGDYDSMPGNDSGHHSGSDSGMDSWEEYGEGSEEHSCVDDDFLVAQFAGSMGITSCSAASAYCNHPDFPNIMVACCATCTTPAVRR